MWALLKRDLKLVFTLGDSPFLALLFFALFITVVPFAVGPDHALLQQINIGILWLALLFATLLHIPALLEQDKKDGSLDIFLLDRSLLALTRLMAIKCMSYFVRHVLPLLFFMPFLGPTLDLSLYQEVQTFTALLLGGVAFTCIGASGAALCASSVSSRFLPLLIVLPFSVPILIFGVGATTHTLGNGTIFSDAFLLLLGLSLLFTLLGPLSAALSLRTLMD